MPHICTPPAATFVSPLRSGTERRLEDRLVGAWHRELDLARGVRCSSSLDHRSHRRGIGVLGNRLTVDHEAGHDIAGRQVMHAEARPGAAYREEKRSD